MLHRHVLTVVPAALLLAATSAASAIDFAELTRLAESAVRGENVRRAVPGFELLVLCNGQPLYQQPFGDWTSGRVAEIDSATKTLSGAVVMSVAETSERGFTLDSRLADFLPPFDKPSHRAITVRHAMSLTSGLPSGGFFALSLSSSRITLQQSTARIARGRLADGPPGSKFGYGGLSMQAAGAAVERATGKRYVDLFAERIAAPLGLTQTRFIKASDANPRVAGGAQSTAAEFARFLDMLLNGGVDRATGRRVLRGESVAEMLRRQTTDQQPIVASPTGNNRFGVGVWVDQLGDPVSQTPGVNALAAGAKGFHGWIDPRRGLVLVFATDQTRFRNVHPLARLMRSAVVRAVDTAANVGPA